MGFFIYRDTLNGEVAIRDVMQIDHLSFEIEGEFYACLRQYDELEIFPAPGRSVPPDNIVSLTNERDQDYKDFIGSLGWPLGDGSKLTRDEAIKELQTVSGSSILQSVTLEFVQAIVQRVSFTLDG